MIANIHLVGGFKHVFPFHIWDVILRIDFHIVQDGFCTTNQSSFFKLDNDPNWFSYRMAQAGGNHQQADNSFDHSLRRNAAIACGMMETSIS